MQIQGDCGIKIFLRSVPAYALQVPRRFLLDAPQKQDRIFYRLYLSPNRKDKKADYQYSYPAGQQI